MIDKQSTTQRIRTMVHKGYTNRDIIDKLQCKPQSVYNIRYQMNKERGLGSIGALPKPTDGIGAPPKRKHVRKVKAKTGIANVPKVGDNVGGLTLTDVGNGTLRWVRPPLLPMPEPEYMPITTTEPKPTLWERVKRWFRG